MTRAQFEKLTADYRLAEAEYHAFITPFIATSVEKRSVHPGSDYLTAGDLKRAIELLDKRKRAEHEWFRAMRTGEPTDD